MITKKIFLLLYSKRFFCIKSLEAHGNLEYVYEIKQKRNCKTRRSSKGSINLKVNDISLRKPFLRNLINFFVKAIIDGRKCSSNVGIKRIVGF